jgi:serine/threonine protein phosphatase PrpC
MTSRSYLAPNKNQISSLNNNITVSSVITMPGICDEKEKINQDSYLIKENIFKENFSIYGVFDGHGDNGHLISKYISESMNEYFNNKLNYFLTEEDKENLFTENITNIFLKNYTTILKNTSQKIDEDLNTSITYDISQSGTTSVMLFLLNDQLICSNIGDSQCFIFNCDSEDLWTFEALSFPHLASDEKEQKRILEQGGEIHPYYEQNGIFEGPDRIYAKNKVYPGLVMSRTFGDLEAKKIGVISEPDIIIKKIDSNAKYIVLGSDGLWDVVKPYDVIRIVRPFFNKGDIEGACQTLMKKAKQQWDKGEDERDDITFIVVFIGTPNNCIINEKRHSLKKIDEIDNDGK